MNFLSELIHKKTFSESAYVYLVFAFSAIVLLFNLISGLKLMTLFFFFLFIILYKKVNNFFAVAYILLVFSFSFFRPGKTYVVEIIRGKDLLLPFLKEGYYLGYGVTIPFMFLILTAVFLISFLVQHQHILTKLKRNEIIISSLSLLLFTSIGIISSYLYSPFIALSLTWLAQYIAVLVVSLSTLVMYLMKKMNLVIAAIVANSLFQFIVVLIQFLRQRGAEIEVEFMSVVSQMFTGLDEVNTFFRANGTYMYHNQLALVSAVFFVVFLVLFLYSKKKNEIFYLIMTFLNFVIIIFSQTRIIWVALPFIFLLLFLFNKKSLTKISVIPKFVNVKLLLFLLLFFSMIIIPRVLNSFNSSEKGSGIWLRKEMIEEAVLALEGSPLIGYGIGTNEYVLFKQFPLGVMSVFPAGVHMAFLQLALEVGLWGLFFFLLPFVIVLRYVFTHSVRNKYSLIYFCGIFIFTTYYILHPHVLILESQFLGLLLGIGMIGIYEN